MARAPLTPYDIQRPDPGRDPGVTAQPNRIRDPRGQALAQLGQAQQNFGNALHQVANAAATWAERRKNTEDQVYADNYQLEWAKEVPPLIDQAATNPSDDPNFVQQFDSVTLAEADTRIRDRLRERGLSVSTDGERYVQRVNLNLRTSAATQVAGAVHNARVQRLYDTANLTISEKAKLGFDSGDYDATIAGVDATVDSVIEALPTAKQQSFRDAAHLEAASSVIQGYVARGEFAKANALLNRLQGSAPLATPEAVPGMEVPGNIDLTDRTPVEVDLGAGKTGTATVESESYEIDGRHVLIPTVADGRKLTSDQALNRYMVTKEHLGIFDTPEAATAYGRKLHGEQEALITGKSPRAVASAIVSRAKAQGGDPLVVAGIGWIESKFDPSAKNKDSSAAGLGQFLTATGQLYGLPPDARQASVLRQADALARFTADNVLALKQNLGTEPTPGEVYLAHFLGVDAATRVLSVDPDTPLRKLLPANVLAANPQLARWTAGDVQGWASEKMQGAMEYVTNAGFLEGRKVAPDQAMIPMDKIASLSKFVSKAEEKAQKAQEAEFKTLQEAFDPRNDKADPAGLIAAKSPAVFNAFVAAAEVQASVDASDEDKMAAWQSAVKLSLEEQMRLPGARPETVKALPVAQAKKIVDDLTLFSGSAATEKFMAWKRWSGEHWPRVYKELVQQGLPAAYKVLESKQPTDVTELRAIEQTLNVKEEDLKKDLGSAEVSDGVKAVEDQIAGARENFEFARGGSGATDWESYAEVARKVYLTQIRSGKSAEEALALAENVIGLRPVHAAKVRANLSRAEANLSDADVEDAVAGAQEPKAIYAFDPAPPSYADRDPSFDMTRYLDAASKYGIWRNNEDGDGFELVVPYGNSLVYEPLRNKRGEIYQVKFDNVPKAALRYRYGGLRMGEVAGRAATAQGGDLYTRIDQDVRQARQQLEALGTTIMSGKAMAKGAEPSRLTPAQDIENKDLRNLYTYVNVLGEDRGRAEHAWIGKVEGMSNDELVRQYNLMAQQKFDMDSGERPLDAVQQFIITNRFMFVASEINRRMGAERGKRVLADPNTPGEIEAAILAEEAERNTKTKKKRK